MSERKSRILVVEDEVIIALELAAVLEDYGYDMVAMVATAGDAVLAAEQHKPDLILMDMRLRGKETGLQAAQIVFERFSIPSILVTAHASAAARGEHNTGIYAVVTKPFEHGELQAAIENVLNDFPAG